MVDVVAQDRSPQIGEFVFVQVKDGSFGIFRIVPVGSRDAFLDADDGTHALSLPFGSCNTSEKAAKIIKALNDINGLMNAVCFTEKSDLDVLDVVVVLDEATNHEAIYVNGLLKWQDSTIYACDIHSAAEGKVMRLKRYSVLIEDTVIPFPRTLEECLKYVTNNDCGE